MKKKLCSLGIALLMIISCFTLVACSDDIAKYKINVNVWYSNYGIVYGGGEFDDGTKTTISASNKQDSKFICWIYNNEIVSKDSEYEITISSQTSGTYTAVFTCPDLEFRIPTSFSLISAYDTNDEFTNLNMQVMLGSSYENMTEIYHNDVGSETTFEISNLMAYDYRKAIYATVNLVYTFTTIVDGEDVEISKTFTTNIPLQIKKDDTTTIESSLNLPSTFLGNVKISFDFEKLEYEEPVVEDEN